MNRTDVIVIVAVALPEAAVGCFSELGFGIRVGSFFGFGIWVGSFFGFGLGYEMGCSGSKVEDLPLVIRCRERKELIRAAADHRYALAAAHVSYFHSLKDVGDALRKFVDEELVVASSSTPSSVSSPSLILHSDEGKVKINNNHSNAHVSSGSSVSHSSPVHHIHDDDDESHIHSSSDSEDDEGHIHIHGSSDSLSHVVEEGGSSHSHPNWGPYGVNSPPYGMNQPQYGMNQPPYEMNQPPYGMNQPPYAMNQPPYGMNEPPPRAFWEPYYSFDPQFYSRDASYSNQNSFSNVYYMKRSSPVMKTVIHEAEASSNAYANSHWNSPNENREFFGYPYAMGLPNSGREYESRKPTPPAGPPPPPSPKASVWDFFNPFDGYETGYSSQVNYGYGSVSGSPDSTEVREREGIPDLEEETETEVYKEVDKVNKLNEEVRRRSSGDGSSSSRSIPLQRTDAIPSQSSESSRKSVPQQHNEGSLSSKAAKSASTGASSRRKLSHYDGGSLSSSGVASNSNGDYTKAPLPEDNEGSHGFSGIPSNSSDAPASADMGQEKSSSDTLLAQSTEDRHKTVSFEVDETSRHYVESPDLSSMSLLPPRGTRDLREVVAEIKNEFEIASTYGKEVAVMLEVGRLPYQPNFIKVVLSRILQLLAPSSSDSHPRSTHSVRLASKTRKLAKSYFGDVGKEIDMMPFNISSTLDKLYAWEKKLYKEVKDEEKLRVIYEKQCKKLQTLDEQGAEPSKIDATQVYIRKLLTKLNIGIKAIDSISSRIHKLRDEELEPQVAQLIQGLIRMWKSMLKCHRKQFQAIMESKMRSLRANTGSQSPNATIELEMQLLSWHSRFTDWVYTQKSYVESLNGWLMRNIEYEPEQTADGPVPFSPSRLGAPPIFIICNDWHQAMEVISETRVTSAMHTFASSLRQLFEKQDEEHRQRVRAEFLSEDYRKRLRSLQVEQQKMRHEGAAPEKNGVSIVSSEGGVPSVEDLKVNLGSFKGKLAEEKAKHKDAIKILHDAASSSLQGGLLPIFKALESFTSDALKAHEQVRLQNAAAQNTIHT